MNKYDKSIDAVVACNKRAADNIRKQSEKIVKYHKRLSDQVLRKQAIGTALARITTLMTLSQFKDCRDSLVLTMKAFWWLLPYDVKQGSAEDAIRLLFMAIKEYRKSHKLDYDPVDLDSVCSFDDECQAIWRRDRDICLEHQCDLEQARFEEDLKFEKELTAWVTDLRSRKSPVLSNYNELMSLIREKLERPFRCLRGLNNIHLVLAREAPAYEAWLKCGLLEQAHDHYYSLEQCLDEKAVFERYEQLWAQTHVEAGFDLYLYSERDLDAEAEQYRMADAMEGWGDD